MQQLASQLKTISFHQMENHYRREIVQEEVERVNPERMRMFREGKRFRCSHRVERTNVANSIKKDLLEYFERRPEEDELI
jgi:hypothetical protein